MFNKKGVSEVIATVLIVLVTIAAFVIIGGFVIPFVKDNLSKSSDCLDYKEYFKFNNEFGLNCYRLSGANDKVYIFSVGSAKAGENLSGFYISLYDRNNEAVKRIGLVKSGFEGLSNYNSEQDNSLPLSGKVRTYKYQDTVYYARAEIRAIVDSGQICAVSDSINILPCEE